MKKITSFSRKILVSLFVLSFVALGALGGYLVRPPSSLRAQKLRAGGPIPYTVTTKETIHRPDGTIRIGKEVTQAIRSDGTSVKRHSFPNPARGSDRILKFVDGTEVTINEFTNTKSTVIKKVNPARWQRDPESKCIRSFAGEAKTSLQEQIEGEELIGGFRTVRISIKSDDRKATFW
jgi:hypothetical protein